MGAAEEELAVAHDGALRAQAELENVRKRANRDVENAHKFALENFGRELLAVVDSLEMGLEAADNADAAALREGSEATCKLLKTTLERFGMSEVDPEGEPFDPEMHEAISMMPAEKTIPRAAFQPRSFRTGVISSLIHWSVPRLSRWWNLPR